MPDPKRLAAALTRITKWAAVAAAILAGVLPLPVVWEAVMDSLQMPPIWVFETTSYAIIMLAFAASGYGLHTGYHFRVTLLEDRFPHLAAGLTRFSGVLELGFGLVLLVAGGDQVWTDWMQGLRSDTLLEVPQFLPQLAFPIGGFVIGVQGLAHILDPLAQPPEELGHAWRE